MTLEKGVRHFEVKRHRSAVSVAMIVPCRREAQANNIAKQYEERLLVEAADGLLISNRLPSSALSSHSKVIACRMQFSS